jgi:hypothetical protein
MLPGHHHFSILDEISAPEGAITRALCELVGMTGDPKVRPAAELAIQFAIDAQDAEFGGWRYVPRQDSDTSVTGFIIAIRRRMALQIP